MDNKKVKESTPLLENIKNEFVFNGNPKGDTKELGEVVVSTFNLSKEYHIKSRSDSVIAVHDLSLNIEQETEPIRKGEFVMLRGPSGGGKTTCLNMIGMIDKPTSGILNIFGIDINEKTKESTLAKLRLEKLVLFFKLTIYSDRKKRAIKLLELVGLQDRMNHLPSELSGGEQQRVTIARALCNEPELLLMDEPTGDLDTKNTIDVMDLILDLNQKLQTTIIMVTHNPDIECYADRIIYLQDGGVIKQALNSQQTKLKYSAYMKYLAAKEGK
ncbi:ATP binding cassete (ABC) transporter [Entamoeba marina]